MSVGPPPVLTVARPAPRVPAPPPAGPVPPPPEAAPGPGAAAPAGLGGGAALPPLPDEGPPASLGPLYWPPWASTGALSARIRVATSACRMRVPRGIRGGDHCQLRAPRANSPTSIASRGPRG